MDLPPIDELAAIGLAWVRVSPTVALVPAFGLKALPLPARGVLTLAMAASIHPSLLPIVVAERSVPWPLLALEQLVAGLPVALAAAVPLWAATMAGGLGDALRGAEDGPGLAVVEGKAGSLGVLLSLLASVIFLGTGGAARVTDALATQPLPDHPLLAAAHDLVGGIGIAIALGGPLLASAIVLEVTFALVARAASPAQVHALFAPLRSLGLLAVMAIVLDRMSALVATSIAAYVPG